MPPTTSGRRVLRRTVGAVSVFALLGLGGTPALAEEAGPDLAVGRMTAPTGVKPGTSFDVPVTFTNKGTGAADGVWVSFAMSQGLGGARKYSNCLYYDVPSFDEQPEWSGVHCRFDQAVEPGKVYALAEPLTVDALNNALDESVGVTVSVENPFNPDWEGPHVPGNGPELNLTEQQDAALADQANDPDHATSMRVDVANTADFGVEAPQVRARVGQTVTADVKFANGGPAWVRQEISAGRVDVRFPAGTTVVSAPGSCTSDEPRHHICGPYDAWVDEQGKWSYTFRVKIDTFVAGAEGKASLMGAPWPFDKNAANDTAKIVFENSADTTAGGGSGSASGGSDGETSGGSGGGSGSPSTGGSGSSSAGGAGSSTGGTGAAAAGGNLASTGSGPALPIAGAAATAVAVGGGVVLVMRRRRPQG
ncbi:peptidase [Streptomyces sp. NPDC002889]|uniref:peptidase n=1 Tax=Streptomyces sp. NPDC002889 TaxID=3364669 RepID=UPI0036A8A6D0